MKALAAIGLGILLLTQPVLVAAGAPETRFVKASTNSS